MLPSDTTGNYLYSTAVRSGLLGAAEISHDIAPPTSFVSDRPGYLIWRWGEMESHERVVLTATYRDEDGTGIILTILVGAGGELKEVELWRGDGAAIARLPTVGELEKMIPGKIYE